ncbi:VOC family protein [Secundilactobacillus silagincola]|jgi:catechol-2,3-dioxygenase|uniref:VOC family protein n=1 Tax=Secundilactobacillus silagincola TaxID=1714681 RepID=UPI001CDACDCF|nr:VOC family protein [Secundilactobacillus silagincola]
MTKLNIKDIDSLTLTVSDVNHAMRFYHEVFDLPIIKNAKQPTLQLGHHRLTFRTPNDKDVITAHVVTPGSAELALETHDALEDTLSHLTNYAVEIADGPVPYEGAKGSATALWVRDPDQNLIKIITY